MIARGELPLTAISSKSNHKNKDFQNVIVEHFEDISNQIRSLQNAIAHHRHDFNLRISNMENLLSWRVSKMETLKEHPYTGSPTKIETVGKENQ